MGGEGGRDRFDYLHWALYYSNRARAATPDAFVSAEKRESAVCWWKEEGKKNGCGY